jgi:Zn-dependent peptidase ImmA (M78 family)
MPDVRALAEAYGVRVEAADLGDWGSVTLIAEYDPEGPVIRVNERTVPQRAVDHAVAHELYHHREAIGEIARIGDRAARERAADAFADDLVRTP